MLLRNLQNLKLKVKELFPESYPNFQIKKSYRNANKLVYHSLNFALNVEIPPLELRRQFLVNMYCTKVKSHQNHPNHNLDQDNWQKQYFAEKWGQTSHKTPFEGRTSPISLPVFPLNNPFPYWHYYDPFISTKILSRISALNDTTDKGNISINWSYKHHMEKFTSHLHWWIIEPQL